MTMSDMEVLRMEEFIKNWYNCTLFVRAFMLFWLI